MAFFIFRACNLRHRNNFLFSPSVLTFNSCTKCVGSPSIMYDRWSDCHPVSWAWMCHHYKRAEIDDDDDDIMIPVFYIVVARILCTLTFFPGDLTSEIMSHLHRYWV